MPFTDGLKLRVLVDGVHQVLAGDIQLKIDGKNQPLETLEGLVGKSEGAGSVEISVTGTVLRGGLESDYWTNVANGSYHDIQVPVGSKSYIGSGWFETCSIGQSTGKGTEVSFTWMGEKAPLQ